MQRPCCRLRVLRLLRESHQKLLSSSVHIIRAVSEKTDIQDGLE